MDNEAVEVTERVDNISDLLAGAEATENEDPYLDKVAEPFSPGQMEPDLGTTPPEGHQPGTRMLRLERPMMRGADVKYVQRFIGPRRAGKADGAFGPQAEAGVRWYQNLRGLQVDGIVGPRTWRQMRTPWRG